MYTHYPLYDIVVPNNIEKCIYKTTEFNDCLSKFNQEETSSQ